MTVVLRTDEDSLSKLYCSAQLNTWANQRRKRRLNVGKLKTTIDTFINNKESQSTQKTEVDRNDYGIICCSSSSSNNYENGKKRSCSSHGESQRRPKVAKLENVFLEFNVFVGGLKQNDDFDVFFRMEWINGEEKNAMYQLFQLFRNRFDSKKTFVAS